MPGGTSRYSSEENSGYDGYEDDFELEGELELDAGPEAEGSTAGAAEHGGALEEEDPGEPYSITRSTANTDTAPEASYLSSSQADTTGYGASGPSPEPHTQPASTEPTGPATGVLAPQGDATPGSLPGRSPEGQSHGWPEAQGSTTSMPSYTTTPGTQGQPASSAPAAGPYASYAASITGEPSTSYLLTSVYSASVRRDPLEATLTSGAYQEQLLNTPPPRGPRPHTAPPSTPPGAAAPSPPSPALPPLDPTVSPLILRSSHPAHVEGQGQYGHHHAPAAQPASRPPLGPSAAASSAYSPQHGSAPPPRPTTARGVHPPGSGPQQGKANVQEPQHKQQQDTSAAGGGDEAAAAAAVSALSVALLQQASRSQSAEHSKQLAAAIRHSVDALRASEQVQQLQSRLEALTQQLLAAERGRSAAEGALVELTQRMAEQEKRLIDSYEAKLLEKQREVQQLRTKVQQLESQGVKGRLAAATASSSTNPRSSGGGAVGLGATGGGSGISLEEAAALRKELEQTEVLLRGYQQENEAATRRIKALEESLAAAEARTAEQVLRSERVALLARDESGQHRADTAAKLSRVLALEKELAGVREEAETREAELRSQLDKLRQEKKALEGRAAGVDLKAMADGDVLVKQVREEMEASRAATQVLIQDMQKKLEWYAENQELVTKNDALVAEQRVIIQQLQARLAAYEGGTAAKGPSATRAAAAQARVRELEAQVDQLHKALRGRAPANSLAAVVAAARPSAEESAAALELRERVEELEGQLRHKDEEFEAQLRAYQQQFEKLKAQYAERAGRLEAATKSRGRVKELERQLEDQKGIFTRRVRELEAKIRAMQEQGAAMPPTPAPGAAAAGVPGSALQTPTKGQPPHGSAGQAAGPGGARRDDLVPASQLRAKEAELKKLTAELERKSKQVSELHLKLGEAESRILRLTADLRRAQSSSSHSPGPFARRPTHDSHLDHDERPVGPSRPAYPSDDGSGPGRGTSSSDRAVSLELVERLEERCGGLTVENKNLRGQVERLTGQLAALRRELEGVRRELEAAVAAGENNASGANGGSAASVSELRRQLDAAQLALTTVQRSAAEAVEARALAAAEHQRAMLRLADEVAYREGVKWQQRIASLEQELRSAQQRCEAAEGELAVAASRGAAGTWTPEAAVFAAMERRLDEMAREMATREAKWRAVLQDTQSLHGVQSDLERKNWEAALAAKEAEVQATRAELRSLLEEVAQVQELQARAAARQLRQQHKGEQ